MKWLSIRSVLLGMLTTLTSVYWVNSKLTMIRDTDFKKNAKMVIITDDANCKKDTVFVIPLNASKEFNKHVQKIIQSGEIRITNYNGPKF